MRTPLITSVLAHGALILSWARVPATSRHAIAAATERSTEFELVWLPFVHPQASRRKQEQPPPVTVTPPPSARKTLRTLARYVQRTESAEHREPAVHVRPSEPAVQPPQRSIAGMSVLRSMARDAFAFERWRFGAAPIEGALSPEQLAEQRALDRNVRRITDRWREEVLGVAPPPRPPGSSEYVRRLATAAAKAWAPVIAQDPSVADGLLRLLLAGSEGYRAAQTDALGMFAQGRAAAGADSVNAAHPNSPMLQRNPTLNEVGRATAHRIAVEIDVRQCADGRSPVISIARSSGSTVFDRQAIAAIRRAIDEMGSRRSADSARATRTRWEFELRIGRNPPFALGPQLPDAPVVFNPASGGVEWGGVDPPRSMFPFALHRYQRVRIRWVTEDSASSACASD